MGQALRISCGNTVGQQLFSAIREGDLECVLHMLQDDPKLLNAAFFYERLAPLHVAAQQGQLQVLKMLLQRGAQANVLNSSGQTPLMLACKSGRWTCIQPLLQAGANVLAFDYTRSRTCLHYASRGGHTECVRRILAAAREGTVANSWGFVRFVNLRDGYGITPLHMASRHGHVAVLRLLLDSGALVSATTTTTGNGPGHGSSPLHYAARGGSLECVRELLAWGADRSQRDLTGYTAYGIAMKYSNTACAAILNPNAAEPLVWPSPWKFISELEPEAKTLLEAALAQANDERDREMSSRASRAQSAKSKSHTKRRSLASVLSAPDAVDAPLPPAAATGPPRAPAAAAAVPIEEEKKQETQIAKDNSADAPIETGGLGVQEVCCICFEEFCTIEVKECGHQMCATCTLNLCCHSKPNPAIPYSPPPSCPFCRRNIGHLIIARPKPKLQESKEKSRSRRSRRSGGSRHQSRGGSGGKGSFSGPLFSGRIAGRCGSFGRGSSGRIADVDWVTRV